MCEIGVAGGYSVVSFIRKYPGAEVWGVDINLNKWNSNKNSFKITEDESRRLHILKQDATNNNILR